MTSWYDPANSVLERLKAKYGCRVLSREETAEIDRDINEKMRKVDIEFKRKQAQSIEEAKRTYFTC